MAPASPTALRFSLIMLAGVLACLSLWLVCAESTRPAVGYFPSAGSDLPAFAEVAGATATAAAIGWPRGDLAASKTVTYYSLDFNANDNAETTSADALTAAQLAPFDARPWLILAARDADKTRSQQLLKMSYYAAPARASLFFTRLKVLAQLSAPDDELGTLLEFEIRILLNQDAGFRQTLITRYRTMAAAERQVLDHLIPTFDAALLREMKRGA